MISFNKEGSVRSYTDTKVLRSVDLGSLINVMIKVIVGSITGFAPLLAV